MAPAGRLDEGRARIGFDVRRGRTRLAALEQRQPLRVFLPNVPADEPLQAVIGNTSGGIVGGDRLSLEIETDTGASALITTQAAEKVYRSAGPEASLDVHLRAAPGSVLAWLPHETILFDRLHFRRRLVLEAERGARVLLAEMLVLGRHAHGETLRHGHFRDAWRLRLDGRLLWADALRLDGDLAWPLEAGFGFAGARCLATLVYVGDDARAHLAWVREALADAGFRAGATAFEHVLLVRMLGRDATAVRHAVHHLLPQLRARLLGEPARLPVTFSS